MIPGRALPPKERPRLPLPRSRRRSCRPPRRKPPPPDTGFVQYDAATKTVTFRLVSGPFEFNGFTNGGATLTVPPGSTNVWNFEQNDGTPHSAEIASGTGPVPNSGGDPAIPRAYTNKVAEGLPQGAKDVIRFTAPDSGTFRIVCGVPGHALSGMWLWLKVDPRPRRPRSERHRSPESAAREPGAIQGSGLASYRGFTQHPPQEVPGVAALIWATSSGVPAATTRPPRSPPSGPRSMIQSAVLMTSRLCSITTTLFPLSTSRCSTSSSSRTSSKWRPVVGSSRM